MKLPPGTIQQQLLPKQKEQIIHNSERDKVAAQFYFIFPTKKTILQSFIISTVSNEFIQIHTALSLSSTKSAYSYADRHSHYYYYFFFVMLPSGSQKEEPFSIRCGFWSLAEQPLGESQGHMLDWLAHHSSHTRTHSGELQSIECFFGL